MSGSPREQGQHIPFTKMQDARGNFNFVVIPNLCFGTGRRRRRPATPENLPGLLNRVYRQEIIGIMERNHCKQLNNSTRHDELVIVSLESRRYLTELFAFVELVIFQSHLSRVLLQLSESEYKPRLCASTNISKLQIKSTQRQRMKCTQFISYRLISFIPSSLTS